MPSTYAVRDALETLQEDGWRRDQPFSDEIETTNRVLYAPFAQPSERELALSLWIQRHQPCLFGRIAASRNSIHYCVLLEQDLRRSDQEIAAKIRSEVLAWKRRSLRPTSEDSQPAHGFFLVAISERIATAAPDENLRRLCLLVRDLWDCPTEETDSGTPLHRQELYLHNPNDRTFYKFVAFVDFFAAQGDRRWWHDHRIPGGFAFTANSAGHMRRYNEWYGQRPDQLTWLLQTAMLTINSAAETEWGRATQLRALSNGLPFDDEVSRPFADAKLTKPQLAAKDWTRYDAYLNTDHSVRKEFFRSDPALTAEITSKYWLMPFTYLYRTQEHDHIRLIQGEPISLEDISADIGERADWDSLASPRGKPGRVVPARPGQIASVKRSEIRVTRTRDEDRQMERLLEPCLAWQLSEAETLSILGLEELEGD